MGAEKAARHMVGMDQLCVGLHVRLDTWLGHPFLFSSFVIKNEEQIATLRSMGISEIEYLPQKSKCQPLPRPATPVAPAAAPADGALAALMEEKKAHIAALQKERERIHAAEKKYVKTANAVKNVMRLANSSPTQAAAQAGEIGDELAEIFLSEPSPYIHLMGENAADESAYFHGLNVTVLAMILARALGIDDAEVLRDIAQGAILHDVGKSLIPSQVLLKAEELTHAEAKLLEMHPGYGIKLMQPVAELPRRVREIILHHHEAIDGSGYPQGIKGDAIDRAVRIVSIANAYDNLCNQRVAARSRTPSEALSYLYKNESAKYDKAALPAFIKALGIYPPGTIVVLKSGRVGIVMSVDPSDLLHPDLMLYDPAVPKQDAAVVNLRRDLDDNVERTLRPASLPAAIHDYLSPRKRICYFVDSGGRN